MQQPTENLEIERRSTLRDSLPEISKKKKLCCGILFFRNINYLFSSAHFKRNESTLTRKDLQDLPDSLNIEKIKDKANKVIQELRQEKPLENTSIVIFRLIRKYLKKAIILIGLESTLVIVLTINIKFFLTAVEDAHKHHHIETKELKTMFICTAVATTMTLLIGFMHQHAKRYIQISTAITSQALRALIYSKISKCNSNFLEQLESSVIEKIVFFDIYSVIFYIEKYPDFFTFPVVILVSIVVMTYFISYFSCITLAIFVIIYLLVSLMNQGVTDSMIRSEYYASERSNLINESVSKMQHVKLESMEDYFKHRINELRNKEVHHLHHSASTSIKSVFVMHLAPYISILTILALEIFVLNIEMDIHTVYVIFSIITSLHKHLKAFIYVIDKYLHYIHSIQHINSFLFLIPEKSKSPSIIKDCSLPAGSLIISDCQMEEEDEESMKLALNAIFGWNVDLQSERKNFRQELIAQMKILKDNATNRAASLQYSHTKSSSAHKIKCSNEKILKLLKDNRKVLFKRLSVNIKPSQKVALVGEDDSGIKEFINSVLGENYITKGELRYHGRFVYFDASKPVFLKGKSIRENILVGEKYNAVKYNKILDCVGISWIHFHYGDLTEVIKNAENLSKWERFALLLCRFLYLPGNIYIMVGFFDLVRNHEDIKLLKNILRTVLKSKTVLIQTKSDRIMKLTDQILHFKEKSVREYSGYRESLKGTGNGDHDDILNESKASIGLSCDSPHYNPADSERYVKSKSKEISTITSHNNLRKVGTFTQFQSARKQKFRFQGSEKSLTDNSVSYIYDNSLNEVEKISTLKAVETKVWDETKAYKKQLSLFFRYLIDGGWFKIFFQLALCAASFGLQLLVDFWVGAFSLHIYHFDLLLFLAIIFGTWLVYLIFDMLRSESLHSTLLHKSEVIHNKMLKLLFKLKLSCLKNHSNMRLWFKFSYDLRMVDQHLNHAIHHFLEYFVYWLGSIVLINFVYLGSFFIISLLLGFYLFRVARRFFAVKVRILKFQAESEAKLFSLLVLAIQDQHKYRMMKKSIMLQSSFNQISNEFERANPKSLRSWIGLRITLIKGLIILSSYLIPTLIMVYLGDTYLSRSMIKLALAILWSKKFLGFFDLALENWFSIIQFLTAYGRIDNFLRSSELELTPFDANQEEGSRTTDSESKNKKNPSSLYSIEMRNINVKIKRREVLKNLSLKIAKRIRVGIIGSHYSGKDILFQLLVGVRGCEFSEGCAFRMLGYDFFSTDPKILRQKVMLINDNPQTFSGTIRDNIDPFSKFTNDQIFDVLIRLKVLKILDETVDYSKNNKLKNMLKDIRGISMSAMKDSIKSVDKRKSMFFPIGGVVRRNFRSQSSVMPLGGITGLTGSQKALRTIRHEEPEDPVASAGHGRTPKASDSGNPESKRLFSRKNFDLVNSPAKRVSIELSGSPIKIKNESKDLLKENKKPIGEKELKRLVEFIETNFNSKINEYPIRLRKLIKIAKALLEKPEIVLIYQEALEFGPLKPEDLLRISKEMMPDSTILILTNDFESLMGVDTVLILEKGRIIEYGAVNDLFQDRKSRLMTHFDGARLSLMHKFPTIRFDEDEEIDESEGEEQLHYPEVGEEHISDIDGSEEEDVDELLDLD